MPQHRQILLQVSQVTRAALQSTNRDIHGTEQVYGVLPQFVIPHHAVFRFADNNHLLFLELMDTINTTLLDAVCVFLYGSTESSWSGSEAVSPPG